MDEITLPLDTLDKLKDARRRLDQVERFIAKGRLAKIPVDDIEKAVREAKGRLNALRDGFYPGQSL